MIKHPLSSFFRDRRGTSSIEFAILAPVLIIMTMGMFELGGYSNANVKFTNATQMLGNLVAQQTAMSNSQTSNFCTGAQYALSPPYQRHVFQGDDRERHALRRRHFGRLAGHKLWGGELHQQPRFPCGRAGAECGGQRDYRRLELYLFTAPYPYYPVVEL